MNERAIRLLLVLAVLLVLAIGTIAVRLCGCSARNPCDGPVVVNVSCSDGSRAAPAPRQRLSDRGRVALDDDPDFEPEAPPVFRRVRLFNATDRKVTKVAIKANSTWNLMVSLNLENTSGIPSPPYAGGYIYASADADDNGFPEDTGGTLANAWKLEVTVYLDDPNSSNDVQLPTITLDTLLPLDNFGDILIGLGIDPRDTSKNRVVVVGFHRTSTSALQAMAGWSNY
jgi:hypothetical protein